MASIINALRNLASDSWWVVKILVLSTPVFFFFENNGLENLSSQNSIFIFIMLGILYLGCSAVLMHRNINNKSPLLPSFFSLPELFIKAVGITLVSLPAFAIFIFGINLIYSYIVLEPFLMAVIYICFTLFMSPFMFIPAVLYSVNGRLWDAFNFKIVIDGGGNFSVQFLWFAIQYIFTILLLAILFEQLFINMIDDETAVYVVYSLTVVVSILAMYSYFSDMYGDVIPALKKKKKKNKETTILDS